MNKPMLKKVFFLVVSVMCCLPSLAKALIITSGTPTELAQSLVGSGITIENVSYTGANGAIGFFSGGVSAGIGIEQGIVLTSGSASNLNGTNNTSDAITTNNGLGGNALLNALIPGYHTEDATVLAFDFISDSTAAYFNYVFGSEEYEEYVGSYFNDVFGFFFNGSNIALIPNSSTSVAINNVNQTTNATYYHANDWTNGTPPYSFEYDGFTSVFSASITGLTIGNSYHLTLAIADAGDSILDSGVFLQASSFSDEPIDPEDINNPVPEPSTMLLIGFGLLGIAGVGRKRI